MKVKAKIRRDGKYWLDESNNAWRIVYTSESDANRHSLSMMGCRDCINCYNLIDCSGCRNCYNCVGCTEVMNANSLNDVHR